MGDLQVDRDVPQHQFQNHINSSSSLVSTADTGHPPVDGWESQVITVVVVVVMPTDLLLIQCWLGRGVTFIDPLWWPFFSTPLYALAFLGRKRPANDKVSASSFFADLFSSFFSLSVCLTDIITVYNTEHYWLASTSQLSLFLNSMTSFIFCWCLLLHSCHLAVPDLQV